MQKRRKKVRGRRSFERHAVAFHLDAEEQRILRETEKGEWVSDSETPHRMMAFKESLKQTMKELRGTRKAISLRLPESDIDGLKNIAEKKGVRYQTLLCDVIHRYVARVQ